MKRQEFIDNINTFADLVKVCTENGIFSFANIVTEKQKDMIVKDICMDMLWSGASPHELRAYLDTIPYGHLSYYLFEECFRSFEPLDDSRFPWYKNSALTIMDAEEKWEPEIDDEDQEVTLEELFSYSQSRLQSITSKDDTEIEIRYTNDGLYWHLEF